MSEIVGSASWRPSPPGSTVRKSRRTKRRIQMNLTISSTSIPDTKLAKEATQILREQSTDLLYNHSLRVYLFAAEQGRQQKLRFDPELLYVSAAFHDLGLLKKNPSAPNASEAHGPTP